MNLFWVKTRLYWIMVHILDVIVWFKIMALLRKHEISTRRYCVPINKVDILLKKDQNIRIWFVLNKYLNGQQNYFNTHYETFDI